MNASRVKIECSVLAMAMSLLVLAMSANATIRPLTARDCGPGSEAERRLLDANLNPESIARDILLQENHIRQRESHVEVLIPDGQDGFRIQEAPSFEQAMELARATVTTPLNLRSMLERHSVLARVAPDWLAPVVHAFAGAELTTRVKDFESLRNKIFEHVAQYGSEFHLSQVDDFFGARISVPRLSAIAEVVSAIERLGTLQVVRNQDRHFERGYRATHLTVTAPGGFRFEIQIMTTRMRHWTEWNASRVYKPRADRATPYFQRLRAYNAEIIRYLNALDDGASPAIAAPSFERHALRAEDAFPEEFLR